MLLGEQNTQIESSANKENNIQKGPPPSYEIATNEISSTKAG